MWNLEWKGEESCSRCDKGRGMLQGHLRQVRARMTGGTGRVRRELLLRKQRQGEVWKGRGIIRGPPCTWRRRLDQECDLG